jgi:hypothetical protein
MYPELGFEAGVKAMLDAQINYDEVETAVACYCYVRGKALLISMLVLQQLADIR